MRFCVELYLLTTIVEWLITDLALSLLSLPSMTLETTELLNDVLHQHGPCAIVLTSRVLDQLLELAAEMKAVRSSTLFVLGPITQISQDHARQLGVRILPWKDVEEEGTREKATFPPLGESTVVSIRCTHSRRVQSRSRQFLRDANWPPAAGRFRFVIQDRYFPDQVSSPPDSFTSA